MKKVLLYGVDKTRIDIVKPIFEDTGAIIHLLRNIELHNTLIDVLESDVNLILEEPEYNMNICIFAGYERKEIFDTIDRLKELKIKLPVFATVTKNNLNWKIGRILVDTNQEHEELTGKKS